MIYCCFRWILLKKNILERCVLLIFSTILYVRYLVLRIIIDKSMAQKSSAENEFFCTVYFNKNNLRNSFWLNLRPWS